MDLRPSAPTELVTDCPCPGTPHPDGDTVHFHPRLTWDGGVAATMAMHRAREAGEGDFTEHLERELGLVLIEHGVMDWTFLDGEGKPLAITKAVIRSGALPWNPTLYSLWDRATQLFGVEAFAPLAPRLSTSSQNGQTGPSTSARTTTKPKHRKPSAPSSPATSAASRQ